MKQVHKRLLNLHAAGVFFLGLGVYLFTISPGAVPGRSASIIVRVAELEPVSGYANPLYGLAAKGWLALVGSFTGPALALNLFSVVCGALALSFLFLLVSAMPHDRTSEETGLYTAKKLDSMASAWLAVMAAMFSAPMWVASTRAYENTFGLCILMGTLVLLLRFKQGGGIWLARSIALVIGLGCNELPSMVILFPFLMLALGYLLFVHKLFSTRVILQLAGCILLGGCFSLINAWMFMQSDMYNWAGYDGYMQVVRVLWRDQGQALVQSVPRIGWIIVSFMSIIPLVVIAVPKRAANYPVLGSTSGSWFLHAVLLGASLFILLEGAISPWTLFGDRPLLVSPYLMASAVLGYVVVYWVIVGYGAIRKTFIDRITYRPVVIVGLILTLAMVYRNYPVVHRGPVQLANFVAEKTVAGVENEDWLISGSFMDSLLVIKGAQKGRDLFLINVGAGQAAAYKRYLADQLESPRYRSLLQAGIYPLVQEMITDQVTGYQHVSTYNLPQLFRQNGFISVPHGAYYSAVKNSASIDLEKLFTQQAGFMEELNKRRGWRDSEKIAPVYLAPLLGHLSQNANNLGVLAWELDRPALAEKAFNWALDINRENPSALLNRVSLGPEQAPGAFEGYRQELQEYVDSNQKKFHLWDLSSRHGYVIDPEAFAQEGLTWALSGSVERSMGALQKAKEGLGERADLQWLLSNLYAAQGDVAASRKELESLLSDDSERSKAMFGLARLEMRAGHWVEARKQLELLKPVDGWRHTAEIELALLTALEGRPEEAQKALLEITRLNSDDPRSWLALASVSVDLENSEEVLEDAIAKIIESKVGNVTDTMQFARLLAYRGDYQTAAKILVPAVNSQPMNVSLLEFAVQLDQRTRDIDGARAHVERLLSLDSRSAIGNRVMGSLQVHDGHHALAESSLRVSMESEGHPDAAADLAWLLQRRGEYTEALDFANRAMAFNDQNPSALHTRGLVYYRLGNFEKAKQDLLKALGLWIEDPFARLYLAMVYTATGELDNARELMDVLDPVRLKLPKELQDEMGRVNNEIIEKSNSG